MFDPGNHEHTWDVEELTDNGALAHKTCITNAFNYDAQAQVANPLDAHAYCQEMYWSED